MNADAASVSTMTKGSPMWDDYDRRALKRLADLSAVDANGCWVWQGSQRGNKFRPGCKPYGGFGYRGKTTYAHRTAYMLLVGEIPDGFQLDHLCRVALCVNPAHLEPVTASENMRRAAAARRERLNG